MTTLYAFACRLSWRSEQFESIYNAPSAAKAKAEFLLDVREPVPDAKWNDIRVRKVGGPFTDEHFQHVARMRGMPDLKAGERITSGYGDGVIAGVGGGANFLIEMDSGRYAGKRILLHPCEFKRATASEKERDEPVA